MYESREYGFCHSFFFFYGEMHCDNGNAVTCCKCRYFDGEFRFVNRLSVLFYMILKYETVNVIVCTYKL